MIPFEASLIENENEINTLAEQILGIDVLSDESNYDPKVSLADIPLVKAVEDELLEAENSVVAPLDEPLSPEPNTDEFIVDQVCPDTAERKDRLHSLPSDIQDSVDEPSIQNSDSAKIADKPRKATKPTKKLIPNDFQDSPRSGFVIYRPELLEDTEVESEEEEEEAIPFEFQFAKTSRAKCINCLEKIDKQLVKFCELKKSSANSSHVQCISKKQQSKVKEWVDCFEYLDGYDLLSSKDISFLKLGIFKF
jgi:hypothetical protein